jgi:ABC-type microcin C transport system duplicated ATPase subunit YejF
MTELVALDRVSVQFDLGGGGWFGGRRRILRAAEQVSLEIAEGEVLALVGESGSGKSTLGNVVAGLQAPSEGSIRFRGLPLTRATWKEARRAIQIVFQDPFGALDPRMPVSDIIAEPLRIQGIGTRAERRARAMALVEQVGLPRDALNRYPHEFSGGQRQRIAIARALAPAPKLIVADEPLSALDVSIQSQVLNLMKELQETNGLAYLFISHDLRVVRAMAHEILVMKDGEIVESGATERVMDAPEHPYTRALMAAAFDLAAVPA